MSASRHVVGAVALVAAAALVAGCGPKQPLNVGTSDVPLSLVLGERQAAQTAPIGPLTLPPSIPGTPVFGPPPAAGATAAAPLSQTGPATTVASATVACPNYSPIAPILGVTTAIAAPPAPATYTYRATVEDRTGSTTDSYSGPTTWTVSRASKPNSIGDYTFAISVVAGDQTSVSTYEVVPTGVVVDGQVIPPDVVGTLNGLLATVGAQVGASLPSVTGAPAALGQPGLFLLGMTSTGQKAFQPSSPLMLVQFPITPGASFTATGTDGTTTMTYLSTVGKQVKDNACGLPVQAWRIALTDGRLITEDSAGSTQLLAFTRDLDVATQFGGLIVRDDSTINGQTIPSIAVSLSKVFTIDRLPLTARAQS